MEVNNNGERIRKKGFVVIRKFCGRNKSFF